MRIKIPIPLTVTALLVGILAVTATPSEPFATVPVERRESLKSRMALYVKANRARDWSRLYDLVSDTGRGGATRQTFVTRMRESHGEQFANYPDLLEFQPDRASADERGEFDIYGCGKARREGVMYNGIAVAHAVFEHNNWFFTGWRFTEFPNESCKALADPSWEPDMNMKWNQSMEELRGLPKDIN